MDGQAINDYESKSYGITAIVPYIFGLSLVHYIHDDFRTKRL